MSQIRKLQPGGKVEGKKYKILFDNQEYTIDDEQLNEINNGLSKLDVRYKQYLGGIPSSIQSGSFVGDDIQNLMSLNALSNLTDKQLEFLSKGKRTALEAMMDAPTYQAKEAIHEGLKIIKNVINRKSNSSSNTSKTKIGTDKLQLDFNQDENGEYYLSPTANTNLKAKNRVNQILEHLKNGDASTYDVDGWDLSGIQSWINGLEGDDKNKAAAEYFQNLWTNLDKNNRKALSPDDIDLLENFGIIGERNGSGDKEVSTTERDLKKDFAENPELYSVIGEKYVRGSDGVWRLKSGETPINWGQYGINLNSGQGIYFGDSFYTDTEAGVSGKLNPLRGLTFYGDTIYKLNDPRLKALLDIPETGYNALKRSGNFSGAESIIKTDFRENPIELSRLPQDRYSTFIKDNIMFNNMTGAYDLISSPLTKGQQLIQYVNLNEPEQSGNPYLNYGVKYAVLDENGDLVLPNISESDIKSTGSEEAKEFYTYNRIFKPNSKLNGYYYWQDGSNEDGSPTNIRVYRKPENPNDVIIHLPNLKGASVTNTAIKIPAKAAAIIFKDKDSIDNFTNNMKDPQHLQTFIDLMSMLTTTAFRYNSFHNQAEMISRLQRMGFTKEDAIEIWNAVREQKSSGGDVYNRLNTNTYNEVNVKKMGGKIDHVAKLLKGGKSNGSTKIGDNSQINRTKISPVLGNPAGFGDKLDKADAADVIALISDLASAVITITDPTNIGGATTGVAASLARFAADKTRYENSKRNKDGQVSGKGAGWNLLLNLGMDALSLLPVVGDATAVAKTTWHLRKHLPTLLKLVSAVGMGDAAYTTINKLANNEKLTIRDWSLLANAVTAGASMYRLGGFGKKTKAGAKQYASEKVKIGDAEKNFDSKAIERVRNSANQRKALEQELKRMFPEADEAAISSKATEMLTKKDRNIFRRALGKDGKETLDRSKGRSNPEPIEASDNELYNFWHSAGDERAAYLAQLRGDSAPVRGTKYSRTDIAEAPGTTPGGRYYKDEFGTSYRKGDVSKSNIPEAALAAEKAKLPANGRTGIMDDSGNFTGRVLVESIRETPFKTWNHWAIPNILAFDHTNRIVYKPSDYEEDVTSYQAGGNIRTIVRRNKKNGEYVENVYDGDVPDDKLVYIEGLNTQSNLIANYGNNGQIIGYTLPDEEIIVTREEDQYPSSQAPLKPIYGPEGQIIGWHVSEEAGSPTEVIETPVEENTPSETPSEEVFYTQPDNGVTIAIPKPKRAVSTEFDPKFKFFTENFGINNPTISSLDNIIVPMSKQKVKKFRTKNNNADMAELIDVIKQLSENENNNVIKGQNGIPGLNPNWSPKIDWNPNLNNNKYPKLPDWYTSKIETDPSISGVKVEGVLGMNDFELPSVLDTTNPKDEATSETPETGGKFNYNLPDVSKKLLPALSLLGYLDTWSNQKKYRDIDRKRINAARYDETPVYANLSRTDNPMIDRALRQINEERMIGRKPVTSNFIENEAIKMRMDSQLYDRERSLIGSAAEAYQQSQLENLNINNQNIANAISARNQNVARNATINSAMYNPDLEYLLRRDASNQAARLELQRNIKNDRNTMLTLRKHQYQNYLTETYNNKFDEWFPGARAAYDNLSATDSAKYYDFEDYLKQTKPEEWAAHKKEIEDAKKQMNDDMYQFIAENGLSGYTPKEVFGKTSTVGVDKKGGRINGRTRYTLEPDERVWIDNNKAAHNQIAKLNDHTIKLLLRALK